MSSATASAPRFFRDYNRVISVAYALILLGLLAFFALQLRQRHAEEVALIESQVARHGEFLEFVLRSSTDQLESLRMIAGFDAPSDAHSTRRCQPAAGAGAFRELREVPGGFNRDAIEDKDQGGNLVGLGRLHDGRVFLDRHVRSLHDAHHLLAGFRLDLLLLLGRRVGRRRRAARRVDGHRRRPADDLEQLERVGAGQPGNDEHDQDRAAAARCQPGPAAPHAAPITESMTPGRFFFI